MAINQLALEEVVEKGIIEQGILAEDGRSQLKEACIRRRVT